MLNLWMRQYIFRVCHPLLPQSIIAGFPVSVLLHNFIPLKHNNN